MAMRIAVRKDGKPDMRHASNRLRFLKNPDSNIDGSADIRLAQNRDKIATKREVEKIVKPNVEETYFNLVVKK
jgi:hypothetical protein